MADNDVPTPSIPADPGVLLAQVGRALSEIPFAEAREGCARELGRLGPEVDLTHIDVWRFNRPADRAEQLCRWGIDIDMNATPRWISATVNDRVGEALMVGGGTATVPRAWIDDHGELSLGGTASQVIVSVIDREDGPEVGSTQTTVLIAVPTPRASLTLLSSFIADLSVQLKQFNRRVRTERRFAHLLAVERATGAASLMLAQADAAPDSVSAAVETVREALGARALILAEWHGGHDVELLVAAPPGLPLPAPRHVQVPDLAGVDVESLIAGRFSERQTGRTSNLIDAVLGEEAARLFGDLGPERSVASVPAGTRKRMALGAIRSTDEPWDSGELDALTGFGAMLGQLFERDVAVGKVETREALDQLVATLHDRLDRADPDEFEPIVSDVFSSYGQIADLRALSLRWDGDPVLPPVEWRRETRGDGEAADQTAHTTVSSDDGALGVLEVTWPAGAPAPHAQGAIAALLARAEARARAEREQRFVAEVNAAVARTAGALAHAGPADAEAVLTQCLRDLATTLDSSGLVVWACDETRGVYSVVSSWIADPQVTPASVLTYDEAPSLDRARLTREAIDAPAAGVAPQRLIVPVGVHDRIEHLLAVALDFDDPRLDVKRTVVFRVGNLLSQAVARIQAERYAGLAFDHSPVGIAVSNVHGVTLTANRALVDLAGVDDERDLVGTRFLDHLADPDDPVVWTDHGDVRRSRMRLRRPDGTWWLGQFEIRPVVGTEPEEWLVHVTDVTNRHRAETELRHAATHDSLTGLPNRRALNDALAAIGDDESPALLLLDLDRFKNVNDSLGHEFGDDLLVTIADRLRFSVRPGDLVTRLGGDEFGLLLASPADGLYAGQVADRILRVLADPITIGGHRTYATASVGISLASPADPEAFLREADIAMYQAKDAGGARYAIFDAELQRTVDERHRIETGLRSAIADGQIEAWYQPEVDLRTGIVLGAEALVRWHHPERGVVSAFEFIEVAEQSGLIQDIDRRMLDLACAEAAVWPGGGDGPTVRVNLSAEQLHRDDLVDTVARALATHGLPARRLCLEVTESAAMRDVDRSEAALHALRDLGLELAIDDFGTGYSSLAYLKRFPFTTLKIDRSFVSDLEHDPDDVAFVGSIISLAESLGLTVVAEGIETAEQAAALVKLGCVRGQGYHYAKPAPAAELRDRIG